MKRIFLSILISVFSFNLTVKASRHQDLEDIRNAIGLDRFQGKRGQGITVAVVEHGFDQTAHDPDTVLLRSKTLKEPDVAPTYKSHCKNVVSSLLAVAPGVRVKVFSHYDLDKIAEDPEIKIVSFSSYLSLKPLHFLTLMMNFRVFQDSGKLLLLSLHNEFQPLSSDCAAANPSLAESILFFKTLVSNQSGFSVILCAAGDHRTTRIMGPGLYISPDFKETEGLKDHFLVAPGVNLRLPGSDRDITGCSFATPITAGGAAVLLSNFPDFTDRDLKKYLMAGSRRVSFDLVEPVTLKEKAIFVRYIARKFNGLTFSVEEDDGEFLSQFDFKILDTALLFATSLADNFKEGNTPVICSMFEKVTKGKVIPDTWRPQATCDTPEEKHLFLQSLYAKLFYSFMKYGSQPYEASFVHADSEIKRIVRLFHIHLYRRYLDIGLSYSEALRSLDLH